MRAGRLPLAALLAVLAMEAAAAQPGAFLPQDDLVWVKNSLLSNLDDRPGIENATFGLVAGSQSRPALIVYNGHDAPIRNVTLVLLTGDAPIAYRLGATWAGDPPQETYAHWRGIPPRGGGMVALDLEPAPDASGGHLLRAFVTYELDGELRSSTTTYKAHVTSAGASPAHLLPSFLPLLAGLGLGAAGAVLILRRRSRNRAGK